MLELYKNIVIFLLMNSLVAFSAYIFLKLFYSPSPVDNCLIFAVFFYSQIIITELLLGVFNHLTLNNLLLLNLTITFFAIILIRKKVNRKEQLLFEDSGLMRNKMVVFALSCIIGFGLVKIMVNLINAPFGWDCLNYHFTFPVEWIKNKNLINPMVINCDPSPPYYPINGSLIFLWMMLPFKDVFLADLGQVPFFILCFISVFSIARKIGINKNHSFFAAALFVLIPNFFKQLEIAYVDTIFCAFFLITLNFLLALDKQFNLKNLALAAAGFGLLLGTKNTAVPLGGILLILLILIILHHKIYGRIIYNLCFFGMVAIILGGFSYIRNFILTGNFLYPVNVYIFGKKIFKGVLDITYYKAHYLPNDYSLSKLLFHEGVGIQTVVLFLPALFISIPLTFIKNRQKASLIFIYFLLTPFLIYLASRFIIPLIATRYIYSALALGSIIAFYCMEIFKLNKKAVYLLTAVCIIASLSELARRTQIIWSFIAAFLVFVIIVYCNKLILSRRKKIFLLLFVCTLMILSLGFLERDYLRNEFKRYIKPVMAKPVFWPEAANAWAWINEQTDGPLRIAYVGRPVPFPLYGTQFKNDVYYVSVNGVSPLLHAYPNGNYRRKRDYSTLHSNLSEAGNYRENADYNIWLNNLLQHNTDFLFIYSLHQTKNIEFPIEEEWAKNHSDKFQLVFNNKSIRIYKIKK